MKSLVFQPEALGELDAAAAYYERRREGLGLTFRAAVEKALSTIHRNPGLGATYKSTDLRFQTVRRFPYVVYYAELEDAVWVVAIAHGKRRPGYWRRRRL